MKNQKSTKQKYPLFTHIAIEPLGKSFQVEDLVDVGHRDLALSVFGCMKHQHEYNEAGELQLSLAPVGQF